MLADADPTSIQHCMVHSDSVESQLISLNILVVSPNAVGPAFTMLTQHRPIVGYVQ